MGSLRGPELATSPQGLWQTSKLLWLLAGQSLEVAWGNAGR